MISKALLLFVGLVIATTFATSLDTTLKFRKFIKDHNKTYSSMEEFGMRFKNFQATVDRVWMKNSVSKGPVYGITKFADMSPEEFAEQVLMTPFSPRRTHNRVLKSKSLRDLPAQFDWRNQNAVTPVKDQEQCGSCWAFSATEAIESAWILSGHQMTELAPQQILDCDELSFGCNGGMTESAYHYVEDAGGLDTEASYPYEGSEGTCSFNSNTIGGTITSWEYATELYSESELQQNLVGYGPLSVCVDASAWQDYVSGVMTWEECAYINILDHCVQLVGYNTDASTPYWIVRNSWNTDWGIDGYIWLEMGHDTCGIAHDATWPLVN